MKNRTLPYGYCCKDGVIVTEPQESKVLKRIYAAYLDGSSMPVSYTHLTLPTIA